MKVSARTGDVAACLAASEEDEILVMTANGLVVRTSVGEIRQMGRSVQGVRVMTPAKDDRVIAAERVEAAPDEPEEDEEPEDEDVEVEDNDFADDLGKAGGSDDDAA